jgi:hypothetical protein
MPKVPQFTTLREASVTIHKFVVCALVLAAQAAAHAAGEAPASTDQAAAAATVAAPAPNQSLFAPTEPLHELTPYQANRLKRKAAKIERDGAFDKPDQAQAFYANRRTGPVITRGNAVTPNRSLNTSMYLPAVQQLRSMPRFDSARRVVMASESRASLASTSLRSLAAPGGALGSWTNLGPANQGGRTRALLIDPGSPDTMYAGGVAGGVWKSTDGGANWSTTTDLAMGNLAVVTLAFQPGNSSILYAGTGEGFGNADGVRGNGIFKSVDGGVNWSQLPSTNGTDFHYTMKVIVSPRKVARLYAGTRTGLFRSTDGGGTWTNLGINPSGGCTDMAIQQKRAVGYLYVSCGRTGSQGTIYRVLDSDTALPVAVMSLPGQGRSAIAVAPSNESVVYVSSAQRTAGVAGVGPGLGGLHGIYRSTNSGATFTTQRQGNVAFANTQAKINQLLLSNPVFGLLAECGFGQSQLLNQGWYDNVIAVDPMDANRVWVGGIDLWRSDNGGVDWGTAGYWWFDKGVDAQYHHADQHALVFHPQYDGVNNKVLFSAHDGGVDKTNDARAAVNTTLSQICGNNVAGGHTWTDRSNGYVTTQFYHGDAYPDGNTYLGGLQDNGTLRGSSASTAWNVLAGGDGGYVAVDTKGDAIAANDVIFLENTGNSMQRSTNGGVTFSSVNVGSPGVTPGGFQFIAPFAMNQGNKNHLWAGGFDIWFTSNQATNWTRMTAAVGTCGFGSISAIATHPLDPNRVLVGMSDGCYHYNHAATTPVAGTWPGGSTIGNGSISSMAWDPNNTQVAYATVSNFTTNTVLKSVDGGVTWQPAMGTGLTALPQIPANSVVVNPADSNQVFVGTDLGVFTSIDAGATWYRENTGFANVVVDWLAINPTAPRKLFAFTHGRGAWVTPLATNGTP